MRKLTSKEAKQAGESGKKIRNINFMPHEYIYFKDGNWFTHEDVLVPDNFFWSDALWSDGWEILN
jgi:hypothetical protein